MSKKLILGLVILVSMVSASFAISDPDGLYQPKTEVDSTVTVIDLRSADEMENYVTVDSLVEDLNEVKVNGLPEEFKRRLAAQNKPVVVPNPLADVTTDFFVDANSSSDENAPVNSAQVAAGITLKKGVFNMQFTHSRSYSRYVDSYSGYVEPTFQGTVNNRITFGATFSPDVINPSAPASPVASSAPDAPAEETASVSSTSAVN